MSQMVKFFGDHNTILYGRIDALEKRLKELTLAHDKTVMKYTALQTAHNKLQARYDATSADVSLFGPATKLVNIPATATFINIMMCGGGAIGTTGAGGGGGASVYNIMVPLFNHAGYLIIRAGSGGYDGHHDGISSIVEIAMKNGERRVFDAAGGRGSLGGVNNDNTVFSGNDGSSYSGGSSLFSLSTHADMPGWIGAGGGPTNDKITNGGNGYVSVRFLQ